MRTASRSKAEENRLAGWTTYIAHPLCIFFEFMRWASLYLDWFPGRLLSFRQHEQLLMAVDKLDYFWTRKRQTVTGAAALRVEPPGDDQGDLFNSFPVKSSRARNFRRDGRDGEEEAALVGAEQAIVKRGDAAGLSWEQRHAFRQQLSTEVRSTRIKTVGNDEKLIDAVRKRLDAVRDTNSQSANVSLASLLLSPAQRAGRPVRDERQLRGALVQDNLDHQPYTMRELDSPVHKERFLSSWVPGSDGAPGVALRDLAENENDVNVLWQRFCPDEHSVALAALVTVLSPCSSAREQARKRLIIRSGGRACLLFCGPGENQTKGGMLPQVSPHGDTAQSACHKQSTGIKRLILTMMWHLSRRCNDLLCLPWEEGVGGALLDASETLARSDVYAGRHPTVLRLEHLIVVPLCLFGLTLYASNLMLPQMPVAWAAVLLVVLAMLREAFGRKVAVFLRRFLELQLRVCVCVYQAIGLRHTSSSSYFVVPRLDFTRYSPWWVVLWTLFSCLSCEYLTAMVAGCIVLGMYEQDLLPKIAFLAFSVLSWQHGFTCAFEE